MLEATTAQDIVIGLVSFLFAAAMYLALGLAKVRERLVRIEERIERILDRLKS